MLRIFSHYVPATVLLLIVFEALIWMVSIHVGLSFYVSGPSAPAAALQQVLPALAVAITVGMLIILSSMGLYHLELWPNTRTMLIRVLAAALFGLCITLLVVQMMPSLRWAPDGLAISVAFAITAGSVVRFAVSKWTSHSTFGSRVLVLGTGSRVMRLAELAQRNHNHTVVGYVTLQPSTNHFVPLPHVLPVAPGQSLLSVVEKYGVDQIVLAVRDRRGGLPLKDLLECRLRGIKVTELATFFERQYRQVLLESLNASWMLLGDGFRQGAIRTSVKRLFDLGASTLLLLLAFPVILVAAICIFLESGLPVLYRQERIGQGGRIFTIFKLRSMQNSAESDGTPRWAAANDARVTKVGRIIRMLRIDELPQIINVFKGEMSFVGPRPERPFFVEKLAGQIPYYSLRHSVKPGITGWAQVRYRYGASLEDAVEKLQYDLYYVKNHSLFLDLVILFATVEVILWNRSAR